MGNHMWINVSIWENAHLPSPTRTLTISSHQLTVVGSLEGQVLSCSHNFLIIQAITMYVSSRNRTSACQTRMWKKLEYPNHKRYISNSSSVATMLWESVKRLFLATLIFSCCYWHFYTFLISLLIFSFCYWQFYWFLQLCITAAETELRRLFLVYLIPWSYTNTQILIDMVFHPTCLISPVQKVLINCKQKYCSRHLSDGVSKFCLRAKQLGQFFWLTAPFHTSNPDRHFWCFST